MSVAGSLKQNVTRWIEAAGVRRRGVMGDLVEREPPARRYVPPSCDLCGRHLLLGEPLTHFRKDDGVVVVCPVCEPEALLVGYVRQPSADDTQRWYAPAAQVVRVERRSPATDGTESDNVRAVTTGAKATRKRMKRAA